MPSRTVAGPGSTPEPSGVSVTPVNIWLMPVEMLRCDVTITTSSALMTTTEAMTLPRPPEDGGRLRYLDLDMAYREEGLSRGSEVAQ